MTTVCCEKTTHRAAQEPACNAQCPEDPDSEFLSWQDAAAYDAGVPRFGEIP